MARRLMLFKPKRFNILETITNASRSIRVYLLILITSTGDGSSHLICILASFLPFHWAGLNGKVRMSFINRGSPIILLTFLKLWNFVLLSSCRLLSRIFVSFLPSTTCSGFDFLFTLTTSLIAYLVAWTASGRVGHFSWNIFMYLYSGF